MTDSKKPKQGYKLVKSIFGKYGEIPEEWELNHIFDLVKENRKVTYGIVQPGKFDPNGILLIRGKDYLNDWVKKEEFFRVSKKLHQEYIRSLTKVGDVLICIVGSVGIASQVPDWILEANITQTTARISCNGKKISSKFLMYFLNSNWGRLQSLKFTKGSVQPGLNLDDVEKFLIPTPQIKEQQKIVSVLSNVDNLIKQYDSIIKSTKRLKTGLMQTLLTKGIGHKKFKRIKWYYSKEIEIPIEWEIKKLEQVSKIIDSLHITPKYATDGMPMIRSTEIKYGNLKFEYALRVTKEVYDKFTKNHKPQRNDIVMSRVGTYFVTSFVNTDELFCMGQNTLVIHPKIDPPFLYYYLNSKFVNRQIEFSFDRTTGQKTLSLKNIRNLRIFLPPLTEQKQIASILQKTHSTIDNLESKKIDLEQLKKGLMQILLTGQIRIEI